MPRAWPVETFFNCIWSTLKKRWVFMWDCCWPTAGEQPSIRALPTFIVRNTETLQRKENAYYKLYFVWSVCSCDELGNMMPLMESSVFCSLQNLAAITTSSWSTPLCCMLALRPSSMCTARGRRLALAPLLHHLTWTSFRIWLLILTLKVWDCSTTVLYYYEIIFYFTICSATESI